MTHHRDSYLLLCLHLLAYLGLIYLVFNGTIIDWIITGGMYFVYGCLGATVTFHRLLSHRSWTSPRWFEILGTLAGTLSMIGSSIAWVALHYDHHRHTDQPGDPHSPKHSLIAAYLGGIFIQPNLRRVTGLLRDPLHLFLHKYYFAVHLSVLTVLFFISPMLAVSAYLAPAALVLLIGGSVNTVCHISGYRTYDTNDSSKNNIILGYLLWGEGWHNNHHANPGNYYLGKRWWEVDVSGWIINQIKR